ncbi:MAG: uncharacterized protein QOK31_1489 [Solirubrobacteraceae bacterium]|nr:uncharacterized protein [Solirubrobacteraceae bacterium]
MRAQSRGLRARAHRPWPLPERPWLMGQTWEDLLFAHWRVPAAALERVVPEALRPVDVHDGSAWLGLTPFVVRALRLHGTPPAPRESHFPEVNVRTYVTVGGRPGIHFLSLDAARRLAVHAARRGYRLPYFHAEMHVERAGRDVRYRSRRRSGDGEPAELLGVYRPDGPVFQARPGSLEWFLTERYCLYTLDPAGNVLRAEIHHPPWPLQAAAAEFEVNTMARPFGVDLTGEPLLHFAARQDVVIWRTRRIDALDTTPVRR